MSTTRPLSETPRRRGAQATAAARRRDCGRCGERSGAGRAVRGVTLGVLALVVGFAAACVGAGAEPAAVLTESAPAAELMVHRGDLHERVLLTGELAATRAVDLTVPRSPSWQVQISWLEEDGAEVHAGQKLVELDTTQFTSDLEEKRRALREKENDLERTRAEGRVTEAEKRLAIEQQRAELEKAEGRADVPEGLLAQRELEERRLARTKARVALEKAEAELAATLAANGADLAMKRLDLDSARREITTAEQALASGTLTAPVDGIFVVADHPWEGRKLQEGESVWVGMTVGSIPDLTSMQVVAALSDVDDGRVRPGMEARCTLDAYPETIYPCRVTDVAAVAQEERGSPLLRSFRTRLALGAGTPERLQPGMSVKVEVAAGDRLGVLLAPRAALAATAAPPRARLADGTSVEVSLGPCGPQDCVIESGLAEGDRLAAWGDEPAPGDDPASVAPKVVGSRPEPGAGATAGGAAGEAAAAAAGREATPAREATPSGGTRP